MVVDASVALKWVLDEPGSDAAISLRGEQLIAPVLWLAEAASALWRSVRMGHLTDNEARRFFAELSNAPVTTLSLEPYVEPALRLAIELNHPVYDCLYLAVAMQHGTHVITADRRFAAMAERPGFDGRVRLLGA